MKIRLAWTSVFVLSAALILLLYPYSKTRADHRDAPTIDDYPSLNANDLFMFRDPSGCSRDAAGCNLVMALSVQPLADPKFGPTYHFQTDALYRFNFSTSPDAITKGVSTASIDFVFSPFGNNDTCPAPNPPCQVFEATFPDGSIVDGLTTQGSSSATPKPAVVTQSGPIFIFAGPREDPFFFDRVGWERFIADFNAQTTTPAIPHFNLFTGQDAFLGANINAIVVEFPITMLVPKGSTKLAAWAATHLGDAHDNGVGGGKGNGHDWRFPRNLTQISREGNPVVNTTLIPNTSNDDFNFGIPENDARDFAPLIAGNLIRYGVDQTNVLPALATAIIPNTLKFDTTLPDGYLQVPPNGRQLTDRVTDFLITLYFNVRVPTHATTPCPVAETNFSDCTNPKVPLTVFPFVGPPLQPTP